MAREVIDVCLLMLKESNNRRFDIYSARNSVLISTFFRTNFLEIAVHGNGYMSALYFLCRSHVLIEEIVSCSNNDRFLWFDTNLLKNRDKIA